MIPAELSLTYPIKIIPQKINHFVEFDLIITSCLVSNDEACEEKYMHDNVITVTL